VNQRDKYVGQTVHSKVIIWTHTRSSTWIMKVVSKYNRQHTTQT